VSRTVIGVTTVLYETRWSKRM